MVPVVELPQLKSARSVPAASEMEYPLWTRGDEGEIGDHNAVLRRDTHHSRNRYSTRRDSSLNVGDNHKSANSKRRKFSSESDSDDQKPARGSPGKKKAAPSPKSDGQSPTLVLQPEAVVPPPTLAPRPPSLQPPPDSPTIQTDLEPAATEGPTPHALIGDVVSLKTPQLEPPPANATQPAVVPAPVVTNTTAPTLSSGARKGLEQAPTEVPSLTVTESTPPSSMSALPDRVETARPEPARNDNRHKIEGNLHSSTENALIAVGSIGTSLALALTRPMQFY